MYNPAQTFPRALIPSLTHRYVLLTESATISEWFVTAFYSISSRVCSRRHTRLSEALQQTRKRLQLEVWALHQHSSNIPHSVLQAQGSELACGHVSCGELPHAASLALCWQHLNNQLLSVAFNTFCVCNARLFPK